MGEEGIGKLRHTLAIRSKNGLAFILSAVLVWLFITFVYALPIELKFQNILLLCLTGLLYPTGLIMGKLIRADLDVKDHPLGILGLHFNIAQFLYFPIVFWAFSGSPENMLMIFAIIAGGHFYPYGWLYDSTPYHVMAIAIPVAVWGLNLAGVNLWITAAAVWVLLIALALLLFDDYRKKLNL